jgi:hypothetical protein
MATIISKRQVVRLLIAGQDGFLAESRDVLRAGLSSARWVTVDDTGARHKAKNGICTQIGNVKFAWFGTTSSKSRCNFLQVLRAGYSDYVINTETLAYCANARRGRATYLEFQVPAPLPSYPAGLVLSRFMVMRRPASSSK